MDIPYKNYNHDSYIKSLSKILREKYKEEITTCIEVLDANVPLLKIKKDEICFDFSVSVIPVERIDLNKIVYTFQQLEVRLDESSYSSILGCRDWHFLKRLMNSEKYCGLKFETVKIFNEIIITWSKQRLLYSSVYGYLPGFSLRIMVFHIIKKYGRQVKKLKDLIRLFFKEFYEWRWDRKVLALQMNGKNEGYYNDKYLSNRYFFMHIITPSDKETIRNMTRSSFDLVRAELKRGYEICLKNRDRNLGEISLKIQEKKTEMFKNVDMVLLITLVQKRVTDWVGYTASRLVRIPNSFERRFGVDVLVYPKILRMKKRNKNSEFVRYFVLTVQNLDPKRKLPEFVEYKDILEHFTEQQRNWRFFGKGLDCIIRPVRKEKISKLMEALEEVERE